MRGCLAIPPSRSRGMAVLGALLVVVVASVLAGRLIERQGAMSQAMIIENDRLQARWLLRGGLDWARSVLEWDARNNAVTRGDAPWTRPIDALEIPLADDGRKAWFSGHIEDAQARLNLGNLARGGRIQGPWRETLERLLARLELPAPLAGEIARRVALGQAAPDRPASLVPVQHVDDLASLPAMNPEALARLRPYVAVLPEDSPVNPNTASAELLSALYEELSLAQARVQVNERDKGLWFNNAADFLNRTHLADSPQNVRATLATRSEWYRLVGRVRLEQASVGMEALVHRSPGGTIATHWVRELP